MHEMPTVPTHSPGISRGLAERGQEEEQENEQTMMDMTAHDLRTTLLAIRLYHVNYTVLRTQALGDAVHPRVGSIPFRKWAPGDFYPTVDWF